MDKKKVLLIMVGAVLLLGFFIWYFYQQSSTTAAITEAMIRGDQHLTEEKYPEAVMDYQQVLTLDAEHWQAMMKLGICQRELKNLDEAAKLLRSAQKLCPTEFTGDVKLELVDSLFRKGTPAAAAASLSLLKGIEGELPGQARFQILLGKVYRKLDSFDSALNAFKLALKYDPKSAVACVEIGNLLASHGKFEPAIQAFSRAITLDGKYAPGYEGRAKCYHALKRPLEAQPDEEIFFSLTRK